MADETLRTATSVDEDGVAGRRVNVSTELWNELIERRWRRWLIIWIWRVRKWVHKLRITEWTTINNGWIWSKPNSNWRINASDGWILSTNGNGITAGIRVPSKLWLISRWVMN
jgi:hypothetical protein